MTFFSDVWITPQSPGEGMFLRGMKWSYVREGDNGSGNGGNPLSSL
jgi:hypothetical protein